MADNFTFSKFMKDLIASGLWATMSSTAKSLYPVLLQFTDESFKQVFPGQQKLLELTGFQSKKSLQKAAKELKQIGLIDYIPGSGRIPTKYYFRFDYKNSCIDIERYREAQILRRARLEHPSVVYENAPLRGAQVSPNNININISTNDIQKQQTDFSQTLNKLDNLIKMFLDKFSTNSKTIKNQYIHNLIEKYGSLNTGEAIRIAISKGQDGNIKYLEGILKNKDVQKVNKIKELNNTETIKNLLSKVASKYKPFFDQLIFKHRYEETLYFASYEDIPKNEIESHAAELGYKIKIFITAKEPVKLKIV